MLYQPVARRRLSRSVTFALAFAMGVAAMFTAGGLDLLPSFGNPFAERTVDRSGPALLESLVDLNRYEAASGNFQVLLDVESDARFVPSFIKGERTHFMAVGSVDAEVDFTALAAGDLVVNADRTAVSITLPAPTLGTARVDPEQSRVLSRQRGVVDRVGSVFSDNPTSERELYLLGQRKLTAAAAESDLLARAAANTEAMLTGMLRGLGFEHIAIHFTG